jgi:hypothetical protein
VSGDYPRTLAELMDRSEMVHPDPLHPNLGVSMISRVMVREYVTRVEADNERLRAALRETLNKLEIEHGHSSDHEAVWPSCAVVHAVMDKARRAYLAATPEPGT